MEAATPTCYLCGHTIVEDLAADHVPPRQFYSREIRSRHNPNLRTLPTHSDCNRAYQLDEEYFIHAVGPLALETYSGRSLFRELVDQYHGGRNVPLSQRVFSEFEERPSGLVLPGGQVVKRFDPDRVWNVVWKIVRGLYYVEYEEFLPENTPRTFNIVTPGTKPPDKFFLLPDDPIRGQYPGVFDYKLRKFPEMNDAHLWALLFWDKLIMTAMFHDPRCTCETCKAT